MEDDFSDIEERRINRFKEVIAKRQLNLAIVLENVHDPHNIGAVIRSCDAVGISDVYIVYTHPELIERGIDIGKNASSGGRKWMNFHFYYNVQTCFKVLTEKYTQILATHLAEDSISLYELDLTVPTALVFGNEHKGVSQSALEFCNGNFLIPQMGMVQSLNISVACAVSIFEAARQRKAKGMYDRGFDMNNPKHTEMLTQYIEKHRGKKGYSSSSITKN